MSADQAEQLPLGSMTTEQLLPQTAAGETLEQLEAMGQRLTRLRQEEAQLRLNLSRTIRKARKLGVGTTAMIRATGLARQTVYTMLEEH